MQRRQSMSSTASGHSSTGKFRNRFSDLSQVSEGTERKHDNQNQDNQTGADHDEWVHVTTPEQTQSLDSHTRTDKASRILGIRHRASMEPVPASSRTSIMSTRSAPHHEVVSSHSSNSLPLTSLYVVSGLPKSPHTWTLSDPDSVIGIHHSEGAVSRWWRPEVLGSTVSPGAGGGKRKKRGRPDDLFKGPSTLSKQEIGKMLSKALKLSFTREVEVIASTLQPASTIHSFTFTLPAPSTPLAPNTSTDVLRASALTASDHRSSAATFNYPYSDNPFARPSSSFLGPPSFHGHTSRPLTAASSEHVEPSSGTITYHGVCLTVWSHADAERSSAIRRTLEAGRSRKESGQSIVASRIKSLRADISENDPTLQARRSAKRSSRGPWTDVETDGGETDAMSESDFEVASTVGHGPGESTLFLPGDTVFWLPYALTLVSRHPIYDLMRDYLTLSWARFSKDVQSHTLQISKILSHPAPRAGELVRLDASPKHDTESGLEVVARFPGGLDFGQGLVDINFTMWPLFQALNIDNILTICEIALAPTGRVLFFSRHPAMLSIAVFTIKYLVELRGWNGLALPAVHSRDLKIYIDDPGPWIMGIATEARYSIRPAPEVCVCDLDINYVSCMSPPPGCVSTKKQREGYRQRLQAAFESHYHPDNSIPSEFKEAFPAGRFRPICKIQAKRGASSAVADQILKPDWWHSTRIIQAFDAILQEKYKKPSFFKRISMFGSVKRPPQLSTTELVAQHAIRKRASAFVDARDDLENRIGRLSRRLNFLITESDLWRDKFVTFEQYAEKLSAEAGQLRARINKEQRETKRLSGLVTLTAAEKIKLQNQLKETETAHKDAAVELEKMREAMFTMEQERADMIAEVEAQIERALASMTVGIDDSDYVSSRPNSRLSNVSNPRSRKASGHLRNFGTESTLAETSEDDEIPEMPKIQRETETIQEDEEEDDTIEVKKKRFSASNLDGLQDGMNAVDAGISEKSEKIAQKVIEIQQKLETALATDQRTARWRGNVSNHDSESELSEFGYSRGPSKGSRSTPTSRNRSGTVSSTHTNGTATPVADSTEDGRLMSSVSRKRNNEGTRTPTHPSKNSREERVEAGRVRKVPSSASLSATTPSPSTPALTAVTNGTTDDSDTDFQSAHSASPGGSYRSSKPRQSDDDEDIRLNDLPEEFGTPIVVPRRRLDKSIRNQSQPSPTFSEDTVISRDGI
ncbi:hypothetical protein D9758_000285 [Tetrapyrgos nigripes]|uniref:cDENN domain-containing protein n=1 Tax=Tetrapyrgos nigripes TaxID=182062 RepID=A0A8H5H1K2_9AGAR|nr:hypothetical protein D9758_000285 [Tetrapyrgos nigripes]